MLLGPGRAVGILEDLGRRFLELFTAQLPGWTHQVASNCTSAGGLPHHAPKSAHLLPTCGN